MLLALACSSCTYRTANVNFRALEQSGIYIAHKPTVSGTAKSFGEVEVTRRSFYFSSCSNTAAAAIQDLKKAAFERGGNILTNVRFQARRDLSTNPQCRRNLNYAWLIVPMFLPIPQSVTVRGEAIYDPENFSEGSASFQ